METRRLGQEFSSVYFYILFYFLKTLHREGRYERRGGENVSRIMYYNSLIWLSIFNLSPP